MSLFKILSNPTRHKIQGIWVNDWQVPSIEDRKAMCKAIKKYYEDEIADAYLNGVEDGEHE